MGHVDMAAVRLEGVFSRKLFTPLAGPQETGPDCFTGALPFFLMSA